MTKISLVLVIHNEEKTLARCLQSAVTLVDEIIIIHDGECTDNSKKIAQAYRAKFIEKPRMYEAEFHRILTYKMAKNDWILQLDADEFLTSDFIRQVPILITLGDFITVRWEIFFRNKSYQSLIQRPILFRKSKICFIACPHEAVRPRNRQVQVLNTDFLLYNRPLVGRTAVAVKQKKWAFVHAQALRNWRRLECYHDDKFSSFSLNSLIAINKWLIVIMIIPGFFFLYWYQFLLTGQRAFLWQLPRLTVVYYWQLFQELLKK